MPISYKRAHIESDLMAYPHVGNLIGLGSHRYMCMSDLTQSDEEKYKCEMCDRENSDQFDMVQRSHNGEIVEICPNCALCFDGRNGQLS